MPTPNRGESEQDFIQRCMADEESRRDFSDESQRRAFCQSQWDRDKSDTQSMSKQYPFIASRLFGTPLLITESKLQAILAVLGPKFGIDGLPKPDAATFENSERRRAGYRIENRVGIIPVYGTLISRGDSLDAASGLTGYNRLARAFNMAQEDDEVRHILFDFDTPGGEAALIDALGESLFSARGRKPMTAIVNEEANSAGMWLASAADEVVITRAGEMGSVGVVMTHMSVKGMAENMGVKITHIHAGARKVDFSPYFDLSEQAQAVGQERVMELYDLFVQTVARNRSLSIDAVKATEAAIYTGQKAVDIGFADRVDSYAATLARLQQQSKLVFHSIGANTMADQTPPVDLNAPEIQKAIQEARAEGVQAERERIEAILNHEEAAGRVEMAQSLALETDLNPEQAAKILAKSPKVEAKPDNVTPITPFEAAMARMGNPEVNPDSEASQEEELDDWARRVAGKK